MAGYSADLARALKEAGHAVGVVSSGHAYRASWHGLGDGGCRAVSLPSVEGIARYQIVNSPVLAPSLWQFGGPESEIDCVPVGRAFRRLIGRFRPDVVHVQGFEGFGAGIVQVARRTGAAVLASLHNHHPFCPQVFLMRGRRQPCVDFVGGEACESCEGGIDRAAERRRRAMRAGPAPSLPVPPMPPIQTFHDDGSPTVATLTLWETEHEQWRPMTAGCPAQWNGEGSNGFAERRRAYVAALNDCGRVIAVSPMVRDAACAMGVEPGRAVVLPVGSWAAGCADRPAPGPTDGTLRLVFLGFNTYAKGLPMLVDSIGLLAPELRPRVHLAAFGPGCPGIAERAAAIRPALGGLELGGAYTRESLPRLLDGRHAGVVPSVWWDNGPQTAIEMRCLGLPVLGARTGGVTSIVREGVDGLLFRANDRADLARLMTKLLREPEILPAIRGRAGGWPGMSEHAASLVGLYREALSCGDRRTRRQEAVRARGARAGQRRP